MAEAPTNSFGGLLSSLGAGRGCYATDAIILEKKCILVKIVIYIAVIAGIALAGRFNVAWGARYDLNLIIPKLIVCESGGRSVKVIDSNGYYSYGILQYQKRTWELFSKESGITGNPMVPADAIRMTIWAVQNGKIGHWRNCARKLGFLGLAKM